tara:strand:+ start:2524 stop:2775 length:252 start_codon:yes stop_codon:yes gene_type:complete
MDQKHKIQNEKKEILTIKDICHLFDLSSSAVYKLTHGKKIPHYKPSGGKVYFKKSEVENYFLSNRVASHDEIERRATQHNLSA